MTNFQIHTIDLNFQGVAEAIAAYLIPHRGGAVLVECGPGSTVPALESALAAYGYSPKDITDLLITHIHLDHAGASGWVVKHGARLHVHHMGAPHMIRPERLLSSAGRIYGDMMETLWGEFLPVPEEKVIQHTDGDIIEIGDLRFEAIETPGHATHHFAYLLEDVCFTGDIGGVRLPGPPHIRLPMPPPEFHLEQWVSSLDKLAPYAISKIAPTHFGMYNDLEWHWPHLRAELAAIEIWMEKVMPGSPDPAALQGQLVEWSRQRSLAEGLTDAQIQHLETANPMWMSAAGLHRYWRKFRA